MSLLPLGRSALARELVRLPVKTCDTLMIADAVTMFVDVVVSMLVILTDDDDPRLVMQRLDDLAELVDARPDGELEPVFAQFETFTESDLPGWAKKLNNQQTRLFLRRLLGAATYECWRGRCARMPR